MSPKPIEVSLHRLLKSLGSDKKYLLAVSGGADSMALFHAFKEMQPKIGFSWTVAHVHHGAGSEHRDLAAEFVRDECFKHGVEFFCNSPPRGGGGESEAQLRSFRLEQLRNFKDITKSDFVVFSHHRDDLLETRLIRLIRGTGPEGLAGMRVQKGNVLRPLLTFAKTDLEKYLREKQGEFVADPSNKKTNFLRNWIRRKWLPALEAKRPGSLDRLALSLDSLVDTLDKTPTLEHCFENEKILRSEFVTLPSPDKRRVLGSYLHHRGFKDFGLSHINELIKRLDVEQKDLNFRLLKKSWLANARHIWCE